jgi:hypothetical protein
LVVNVWLELEVSSTVPELCVKVPPVMVKAPPTLSTVLLAPAKVPAPSVKPPVVVTTFAEPCVTVPVYPELIEIEVTLAVASMAHGLTLVPLKTTVSAAAGGPLPPVPQDQAAAVLQLPPPVPPVPGFHVQVRAQELRAAKQANRKAAVTRAPLFTPRGNDGGRAVARKPMALEDVRRGVLLSIGLHATSAADPAD